MAINTHISNYSQSLEIAKSHSSELLEVNKDGTVRTQNALDKLKTFGSRLVGKYDQVKKEKDAAVANALTTLWALATTAKARGAKGEFDPLFRQDYHLSNPTLKHFFDARNEIANSPKGKIETRAQSAKVVRSNDARPAKAVSKASVGNIGDGGSKLKELHHAQAKALKQISQALNDFALQEGPTSDQNIAALSVSFKLDKAAQKLGKSSDIKTLDWGKDVIRHLSAQGFQLGHEPLAQFKGLAGSADDQSKVIAWSKTQ